MKSIELNPEPDRAAMYDGIPTLCFSFEVPADGDLMGNSLVEEIAMRFIWGGVNVLMNQVAIDTGRMEDDYD